MWGTSERLVGFSLEKLKVISQFMPLWHRGWNHQTMKSKFASSITVLGISSFFFPFFFPFFFSPWEVVSSVCMFLFFLQHATHLWSPPDLQLGLCWAITMHKPVDAHVWRQLYLSAVARCSDSYCIFIRAKRVSNCYMQEQKNWPSGCVSGCSDNLLVLVWKKLSWF